MEKIEVAEMGRVENPIARSEQKTRKARKVLMVMLAVLVTVVTMVGLLGVMSVCPVYADAPGLSVSKTSSAGGSGVRPGDTITYTIVVSNAGPDSVTDVTVTDPLPDNATYVPDSCEVTAPNTVRDEFNTQVYSNNDGTMNWSGDWQEYWESDGPTAGYVRVIADGAEQYALRAGARNQDRGAYRVADLSGYANAVLSFDFRRQGLESNDHFYVYASSDGGSTWTRLGDINGGGTDSSYRSVSGDITDYMSANTAVGFLSDFNGGWWDTDYVYVDNVQIRFEATAAGGAPPNLVAAADGYNLLPGEAMTITFQVTVDDPLSPSVTEIVNTASVTSNEQPDPLTDTVTDTLAGATIGDFVWDDADEDMEQDGDEVGFADITVELYEDENGDGVIDPEDDLIATTSTDDNGNYDFTDVAAGNWIVDVDETDPDLPSGATLTTDNDPLSVTVTWGQDYNGADFGFDPPPTAVTLFSFIARPVSAVPASQGDFSFWLWVGPAGLAVLAMGQIRRVARKVLHQAQTRHRQAEERRSTRSKRTGNT
jgi:uncharacterized repeat protein (TIGR01451 family)